MSLRNNITWLDEDVVLAIHEAQTAEHGGASGVRDPGLLASALARAQNAAAYSQADIPTLAALYALGTIKNHPFIDGNKRVRAVLLETFLELNGYELDASDAEFFTTIMSVAASAMTEGDFTAWVHQHTRRTDI